jgi:hypothetical protein
MAAAKQPLASSGRTGRHPPIIQLKELEPVAPQFSVTALRDRLRARPGTG